MSTNRENAFRLSNTIETIQDINSIDTINTRIVAAPAPVDRSITFSVANEPVLKLEHNGDIYVHGRLAANDLEVVDALRIFLSGQGLL